MNKLEISAVKVKNSLNQLFPGNYEKSFSSAIITAGGSGLRLGGTPKQLRDLCGKPCILYSLLSLNFTISPTCIIHISFPIYSSLYVQSNE